MKRLLRFMPRRAVLHKYPVIGRFAHQLRRFDPLWSFRRRHLRRAYYLGSIISFLPLLGFQLPIAAAAAVLFRSNVMVMGGLQFLTNPLTAAPIYFATHRLGELVLRRFRAPAPTATAEHELVKLGGLVADTLTDDNPQPVTLTTRLRLALQSMVVGGLLAGLAFGGLLDLIDSLIRKEKAALLARKEHHGSAAGRKPP
jgi:uncharacterized protein (DUF2062 family)